MTTRTIRVSAASMRQRFHGCDPDYIANVCKGSCCRSSKGGILVTIHRNETAAVEAVGGIVDNGFLVPINGRCGFQTDDNLCGLHNTDAKPFGCIVSPFTLTRNGATLIVRNRYRLLKCYRDGDVPAYIAFRASLERLFGRGVTRAITAHLDNGGGDLDAPIDIDTWQTLIDNDHAKGNR